MTDFSDKYSVLRDFFGHTDFREGQLPLIDALLSGRDAVGIMPTGAGKSMCYQIPALMLDGITLVISPLISLMKDQVNSLIQSGVRAAYLNSSLTTQQYNTAIANASRGMYKLIYVAPERLCTPSFLGLARNVKISLVAVDEAHCVSQWGQDFRPHYLRISEFLEQLPYRPTVGAFTATATDQVRSDIVRMLGLNDPVSVTTGFDRENLYFGVKHAKDKYAAAKKIVLENKGSCGIIYCATRKAVDEVSEKLTADGIACTRYHAGLSAEERKKNQDDFIYDRVNLIAATNAFGMGIDKSNVSFVIHYNMPKNLENYYQEAGRAGRDGSEAKCILLYGARDIVTNKFLIENSRDNSELDDEAQELVKKRDLQKLRQMTDYCNTGRCLRQFILDYFGEKRQCSCGNCSNCLGETELTDITVDAQKILSCVYRLHQRNMHFGAVVVSAVLKGSANSKIKQFGLDTLSTYSIMKDVSTAQIRSEIQYLQAEGYLTEGEHSTLVLTRRSAEVLMQNKKVSMRLPKHSKDEPAVIKKKERGVTAFDRELFERLRELRAKLAAEISVPAYIVFGDSALREMCVRMPVTQSDFLEVPGVGKVKQERYGMYFTAEINKYLREHPERKNMQSDTAESGSLADMIKNGAEGLQGMDEELSLPQMCDEILTQLGLSADKKPVSEAIKSWLINENYLTEKVENGQKRLAATILSEEAGIIEREKISSLNRTYKTVLFPRTAQEFVYDNLNEIL